MIIVYLMLFGLLALVGAIVYFLSSLNQSAEMHQNGRNLITGIILLVISMLFLFQAGARLDALEAAKAAKEQK